MARFDLTFLAFRKRRDLRLEGSEGDHTYAEEGWKLEHTIWGTIDRSAAPVVLKLLRFLFLVPLVLQVLAHFLPSYSLRF